MTQTRNLSEIEFNRVKPPFGQWRKRSRNSSFEVVKKKQQQFVDIESIIKEFRAKLLCLFKLMLELCAFLMIDTGNSIQI